jgi:hypothetical protein
MPTVYAESPASLIVTSGDDLAGGGKIFLKEKV